MFMGTKWTCILDLTWIEGGRWHRRKYHCRRVGSPAVFVISTQQVMSGEEQLPEKIQEVLEEWGNRWLWRSL
jgi:hypothetical protein